MTSLRQYATICANIRQYLTGNDREWQYTTRFDNILQGMTGNDNIRQYSTNRRKKVTLGCCPTWLIRCFLPHIIYEVKNKYASIAKIWDLPSALHRTFTFSRGRPGYTLNISIIVKLQDGGLGQGHKNREKPPLRRLYTPQGLHNLLTWDARSTEQIYVRQKSAHL